MAMTKIDGADLSTYVTVGMRISKAKKENRNGVKSRMLTLTLKDEYSPLGDPVKRVLFEEEIPGIYDILKNYLIDPSITDTNDPRCGLIDLQTLKESEDGKTGLLKNFFKFPGGQVEPYKLKKGLCYGNDVDGNRTKAGSAGNERDVIKDTIDVFVQVKYILYIDGQEPKTVYVSGLDVNSQGQRLEQTFWREPYVPADRNIASTPLISDETSAPPAEEAQATPVDDPF